LETKPLAKANNKDDLQQSKTVKKQQTVRERAQAGDTRRSKRIRKNAGRVASPIKKLNVFKGRRLPTRPLPQNRFGRILRKIGRIIFPRFFADAWREIRMVTWPNFKETYRLTMAVFIFAVVFAVIVGALDFGLDKLFREVIIGKK
jgi:preprotein translocase SecE subunit